MENKNKKSNVDEEKDHLLNMIGEQEAKKYFLNNALAVSFLLNEDQ
jgi:hypothetical protein